MCVELGIKWKGKERRRESVCRIRNKVERKGEERRRERVENQE